MGQRASQDQTEEQQQQAHKETIDVKLDKIDEQIAGVPTITRTAQNENGPSTSGVHAFQPGVLRESIPPIRGNIQHQENMPPANRNIPLPPSPESGPPLVEDFMFTDLHLREVNNAGRNQNMRDTQYGPPSNAVMMMQSGTGYNDFPNEAPVSMPNQGNAYLAERSDDARRRFYGEQATNQLALDISNRSGFQLPSYNYNTQRELRNRPSTPAIDDFEVFARSGETDLGYPFEDTQFMQSPRVSNLPMPRPYTRRSSYDRSENDNSNERRQNRRSSSPDQIPETSFQRTGDFRNSGGYCNGTRSRGNRYKTSFKRTVSPRQSFYPKRSRQGMRFVIENAIFRCH